ncbi:MAG: redoxin family protein [Eubacteriales bacterium]
MKKLIILLSVVAASALVLAACAPKAMDEVNTEDSMTPDTQDTMEDNTMEEQEMTKEDTSMEEEDMSPNFLDVTMMDVDGNEWNLAELGDEAVVKVWASWCSICLAGMDEYNTFAGEYTDAKVLTVVSPGMLGEQSKEDFVSWFKSLDGVENIVVILDEDGLLIKNLGIRGFPTYVYLNSNGRADSIAVGHQQTADVVAKLESIQ